MLANNADRKSGHVLLAEGRLWAIDNGLSFHTQHKLRTVIWDFCGEPLPAHAPRRRRTAGGRRAARGDSVTSSRPTKPRPWGAGGRLLAEGRLPLPDEDREWPPYPWPLV